MKSLIAPLLIQSNILQLEERFPPQTVAMTKSFVSLIGLRDHYTASHSARVANYVRAIALELGLSDEDRETAVFAASLHDIGKIGIPDHILLKPGKLTEEELAWIQKCPEWGWMTLRHLDGFQEAARIVLHQCERMDGTGYPERLKGEEIPLGSRMITIADSYDALTTNRPYRTALTREEALAELNRCSGAQFDPQVLNAFRVVLGRCK
jgi:HD-GYP domain-containing protein (c-di-GMP phosphodiesterase class II)